MTYTARAYPDRPLVGSLWQSNDSRDWGGRKVRVTESCPGGQTGISKVRVRNTKTNRLSTIRLGLLIQRGVRGYTPVEE